MTDAAVLSGLIPPAGRCHISSYGRRRNAILERMSDVWVIAQALPTSPSCRSIWLNDALRQEVHSTDAVPSADAVESSNEGLGAVLACAKTTQYQARCSTHLPEPVLQVSTRCRDAVLIELSSEYCKIMEKRLAGEAIGTFD